MKNKIFPNGSVERKKVQIIYRILVLVLTVLVGGTSLIMGEEAGKGALIGCCVVAVNYFISQEFLKKMMFSGHLPTYSIIFYVAKLAGSVAIIYLSIKIGVNLIGLMIGLSAFWITSILSIFVKSMTVPQGKNSGV